MKKIVITAGGTSEKIDQVRKITNSSTGKLGMEITKHLLESQDDIIIYYVCSKSSYRPIDKRVQVIEIKGTIDLKKTVEDLLLNESIDVFIHSMAVSDYMTDYVTTLSYIKESVKKYPSLDEAFSHIKVLDGNKISSYEDHLVIVLKPTPKIISLIKTISPTTYLVGFKLLDGVDKKTLIQVAKNLRDKNQCDLVVANDLELIRKGEHRAYLVDKEDQVEEALSKDDIAQKLVRRISSI